MKIKRLETDDWPLPTKAHFSDAGIDFSATKDVIIYGRRVEMIGTGYAVEIPRNSVGFLFVRSSYAKEGLILANSVGIIDHGYTGELKALVTNLSTMDFEIKRGMRLFQLVVCPLATGSFYIDLVDELPETNRGTGGFGSTGLYN